ncbi:MAG: apolipoprotein N-acyltransferase [Hyphomonadaceae bacterium]|nr:apolipoprotein N-acyltransferase [Hyphomonadaceae bacterium]
MGEPTVAPARPGGVAHVRAWIGAQSGWRGATLDFAAGAFGVLAQAPFHFVPALAVAFTIFIWRIDAIATERRRRRAAFARAFWFGFGYFLAGTYWISSAFLVDSDTWGPMWGIPATLAMGGGLSVLFWAPAFALAVPLWRPGWGRLALFALTLSLAEYARGHLFGGFPWNLVGYVWPAGGGVSQLAAYIGIYGLSTLTALAAATPASLTDEGAGRAGRLAPILAAALGIGLAWGAGLQRLAQAASPVPGASPIVRVADAGVSQRDKWQRLPDQEWRILERYAAVAGRPQDSRAQVVVWPEGAIPAVNFMPLENPAFLAAIGQALGDRALVIGFTRRALNANGEMQYFNSAGVIDGVGGEPRIAQIYDKNRLVPFGEFIPLWGLVSSANIAPLQQIGAGFTPGAPPTRLVVPEAPSAVVLICYEAIFTGFVPRGAERPGWLISITNDAWFGRGTGPFQHYNMARYRAIEEGLPMARAASGGVSAIVDAYGRTVVKTGLEGGEVESQLPGEVAPTLYSRLGNLLTLLVLFAVSLVYLASPRAGGARHV